MKQIARFIGSVLTIVTLLVTVFGVWQARELLLTRTRKGKTQTLSRIRQEDVEEGSVPAPMEEELVELRPIAS